MSTSFRASNHRSSLARMLTVWPASYINYLPTNDVVLVSRFWKPGRPLEMKRRDEQAREALARLFPGRGSYRPIPKT